MPDETTIQPRHVPQVMVSSTFTNLKEHRAALIDAIHHHKLHANVLEQVSARLVDIVDSSLQMVRDSTSYISVNSIQYGQTPECENPNPARLSITGLKFDKTQRLGRPILLFIMGDTHPVTKNDIKDKPDNEAKLDAFRERAKMATPVSLAHRFYAAFYSLDDFKGKLNTALAELDRKLSFEVSSKQQISGALTALIVCQLEFTRLLKT